MFVSQDGSNAKLTNLFKLAVLPDETFNLAEEVILKYNHNQLVPPASSHQRQREELTSSSFSFLKGLNPLKEEDEGVIIKRSTEEVAGDKDSAWWAGI